MSCHCIRLSEYCCQENKRVLSRYYKVDSNLMLFSYLFIQNWVARSKNESLVVLKNKHQIKSELKIKSNA